MKRTLRVALLLSFAGALLATVSNVAQAQKVDVAFGISTMDAPGIGNLTISDTSHAPVSIPSGAYPGFSGDVLFYHNLGIGAEVFWRAGQADNYAGQGFNYRPLFYDINAVYSPKLVNHVYAELVGGVGSLSTRFYTGTSCGYYSCTNYQSSNHFDVDFGGGLKLYPAHNFFIRPEARVYVINNNTDFSSSHALRYGLSIGYTFH
ncbi:MAG: hypothetical protein WA172_19505 [Terriglobales bacterium]